MYIEIEKLRQLVEITPSFDAYDLIDIIETHGSELTPDQVMEWFEDPMINTYDKEQVINKVLKMGA